jgi:hypothetical protein
MSQKDTLVRRKIMVLNGYIWVGESDECKAVSASLSAV